MNSNKIKTSVFLRQGLTVLISITLILAMTACDVTQNNDDVKPQTSDSVRLELSQSEMEQLMQQVAEKDVETDYTEYVPDEAFANAEIFGIDRDGDNATAYAYLFTADYVTFKGKAYQQSAALGTALIRFRYGNNGIELKKIKWNLGGELYQTWLDENFPVEYAEESKKYYGETDENGVNKHVAELKRGLIRQVEDKMGVPVETENVLDIEDDGKYSLWREKAETPVFDTEVLEKGRLKKRRI